MQDKIERDSAELLIAIYEGAKANSDIKPESGTSFSLRSVVDARALENAIDIFNALVKYNLVVGRTYRG